MGMCVTETAAALQLNDFTGLQTEMIQIFPDEYSGPFNELDEHLSAKNNESHGLIRRFYSSPLPPSSPPRDTESSINVDQPHPMPSGSRRGGDRESDDGQETDVDRSVSSEDGVMQDAEEAEPDRGELFAWAYDGVSIQLRNSCQEPPKTTALKTRTSRTRAQAAAYMLIWVVGVGLGVGRLEPHASQTNS